MGVVQHHDGVSGTEKQAVAFDYAERLSDGINAALVYSNSVKLCLTVFYFDFRMLSMKHIQSF